VSRPRNNLPACLLVFLAAVVAPAFANSPGPGQGRPGEHRADTGLRLLFIGNSLTYTNDLPEMLARMLQRNGVAVDRVESEARPNFGLPDHWSSKSTLAAIAADDWDYVILQQGPSATEGRPYLLEFAPLFADKIRQTGAEPVFYMVWPAGNRLRDFPGVAESYRMAARAVDGMLFPVGEAWMAAWRRNPRLRLYGPDGFHPSRLGTYLAALVMYQQLSGLDPLELPASIPGYRKDDPIPEAIADLLQEAATEANAAVLAEFRR